MSSRGPYCNACGHEYRTKDFKPAPFVGWCPYCGSISQPVTVKPFHEFSKSQLERWGLPGEKFGCPARYFFKYVMHLPDPKSPELDFGIAGHAMAEDWMTRSTWPQVNSLEMKSTQSRAAMSLLGGIPHMPPPTLPGLEVESEFHYDFEGVHYMGYKDVWAPLSGTTASLGPVPPDALRFMGRVGLDGISGGVSVVGDWKFVSQKSFTSYTPIPEKLATDLQATLEAYDDIRRGATDVHLNWVYMPRGERNGKPVRACVHPDTIVPRMREINKTAREILHVLQSPPSDAREIRTNANACNAYNRPCPYLNVCHVSQTDQLTSVLGGFAMAQSNNFPPPAINPPPFAPSFAPPAPQNGGALAALVGGLGQPAPAAAPQAQPQPEAINPNAVYAVMWSGQRYEIPGSQVAGVIAAGGTVLGPVAPPAPAVPPAASPVAQAPAASPVSSTQFTPGASAFTTTIAVPAPAPQTAKPTRGRRKATAPVAPAPQAPAGFAPLPQAPVAEEIETEDEDADLVDAVNHVFEALRLSVRLTRV